MNIGHTVSAWRLIEAYLSKIKDPILRNGLRYEFEKKAINEWGYCPAETQSYKAEDVKPELNEEEEKDHLHKVTLSNMIDFINSGKTYLDIPSDIRCPSLQKIYNEAFNIVFDIKA